MRKIGWVSNYEEKLNNNQFHFFGEVENSMRSFRPSSTFCKVTNDHCLFVYLQSWQIIKSDRIQELLYYCTKEPGAETSSKSRVIRNCDDHLRTSFPPHDQT